MSSEKARVWLLFPQRTTRPGVWQTAGGFLVTAHFSRPAFLTPAISFWFTWVLPPSSGRPGGRGSGPAAFGGRRCPKAELRGRGRARSAAPLPRQPLGRRLHFPQPVPRRAGSGSVENPLIPTVTLLWEVASPSATQDSGKPEAVPRLKAKGPFISRAPASNWPFVC